VRVNIQYFISALFLMTFLSLGFDAKAQVPEQKATIFDEATVVYKEMMYGGLFLHTNGFGASYTYGRNKTAFESATYQIDVAIMRHPKEVRSLNPFYEDSRSFVYGKLNAFFQIRPSYGKRVLKYDKIRTSGVAVGYSWRVGPALGFTKPVYLELIPRDEGSPFRRPPIVERATLDHFERAQVDVFGRAGGLRGFNEIQFHPGLHGAFAFNFDYDPRREGMKGLEVGVAVEYYPLSDIEIMAATRNTNLFVNLFLTLQFGKKYNR